MLQKIDMQTRRLLAFSIPIALAILVFVRFFYGELIIYFQNVLFDQIRTGLDSNDIEQLGQIGDFWGGIINPIIGLVTIFFLAYNYTISKEQLDNAKEQLKNANEQSNYDNELKLISPKLEKIEQLASVANSETLAELLLTRLDKITLGKHTGLILSDLNENSTLDEIKLTKLIGAALINIEDSDLTEDKKSILTKHLLLNLGNLQQPLVTMVAINAFQSQRNDIYFESLQLAILNLKILKTPHLLPEALHPFLEKSHAFNEPQRKMAAKGMRILRQYFCAAENSNVAFTTTQETIEHFQDAQQKSPFDLMIIETTHPREQLMCKFHHNERSLTAENIDIELIEEIIQSNKNKINGKIFKIELITNYNATEVIKRGHLNNPDFIKFLEDTEKSFCQAY